MLKNTLTRTSFLAVILIALFLTPGLARAQDILFLKKTAAFYQEDQKWNELTEAKEIGGEISDVTSLPLVSTGIKHVKFEGKVYSVEREGLYRFVQFPKSVVNLISRKDADSMVPILRGLSQLHIHGNRDERIDEAVEKLKTMAWISRTCGPIRDLSYTVLRRQAGFWPRSINTVTNDTLSGFDDGHQMMEVYYPLQKKWILVDIDMGHLFQVKGSEDYLSLIEFWQIIHDDKPFELVKLSTKEVDPSFSIALYSRLQFSTPELTKAWYRRVCQIVSINDKAFAWDDASRKRVTELWGKDMLQDQDAWMKEWYKPVQ